MLQPYFLSELKRGGQSLYLRRDTFLAGVVQVGPTQKHCTAFLTPGTDLALESVPFVSHFWQRDGSALWRPCAPCLALPQRPLFSCLETFIQAAPSPASPL